MKKGEPMKVTIFYSWQGDLPNAANRAFIEQAILKDITLRGR
jgi:hypothetical protein